jgi:hypothetical protein
MTRGFDERLAAVDDALTDVALDENRDDGVATGDAVRNGSNGVDVSNDVDGERGEEVGRGVGVERDAGGGSSAVGVDDEVVADVAALSDRVAELEAAVQALRGYAGSVRAVNDRVEERADVAVATVDDVRERVAALERDGVRATDAPTGGSSAGGTGGCGCTCEDSDGSGVAARSRDTRDSRAVTGSENAGRSDGSGRSGGGSRSDGSGRSGGGSRSDGSGRSGGGSRSGDVPGWPPADPGAPYGGVDADDDREQPGLVARLRDAL